MMETNFTQSLFLVRLLTVILISTVSTYSSFAQSCACKESIQVSLDDDGEATITPSMLLADNATCAGVQTVTVMLTPTGTPIAGSPDVDCSHVGKTLYGKVSNGSNSCWSRIVVEDKQKPTITCPTGIMVLTCAQMATFVPDTYDNCGIKKLDTISNTVTVNTCSNGLAANILKRIVRVYQVTDIHGNKSATCTITFDVTTIPDLNAIAMPASFLVASSTSLECDGNFSRLPNGDPSPLSVKNDRGVVTKPGTGVPQLGSLALYPDPDLYCNLLVSYSDTKLPKIGCVTKIMRSWSVIEWSCLNRTRAPFVQIIEIKDTKGPVISPLVNIDATTSNHTCEANVTFAAAVVTDNCAAATSITTDITIYPNGDLGTPGIFIKNGSPKVAKLPVGTHIAVYTAYDDCYNSSTASIVVDVEDITPPVTICDEFATVGLTSDGTAWVPATVFDDGSYDECGLNKMLVRRMNNTSCGTCDVPTFPGFKLLGERGGHYYYTSDHSAIGKVAFKNAKAMGGYAVSFETPAEAEWLIDQLDAKDLEDCYTIGINLGNLSTLPILKWESGAIFNYDDFFGITKADPNIAYVCVSGTFGANPVDPKLPNKYIIEITDPCGWSSAAKFCCSDIGANQMVAFRTIDNAGNFNDCMVSAVIQDKIGPSITCPGDRTVTCDFAYDPRNLRKDFGWPTATDNCENPTITRIDSTVLVNSCRIGTITRRFMVTDRGGRTASCTQVITFRPDASQIYNGPTVAQWPRDTMISGCGNASAPAFLPAVLGSPVLSDGACSLVGAQYDDQTFSFNNPTSPACFKILRKWTIIDWCQPLVGGGYRTWERTQEIKVIDNIAPVFGALAPTVTANTFDATCADGEISLKASATDVCTTVLKWSYKIDAFNDGTFLPTVSNSGNSIDASGVYPVGTHKIVYTFEDKCGNVSSREQLFSIVNKKAPNAYVKNGLAINLMEIEPGDASAEIWATDFDNGSSHPCGYKILISFTPVTVVNVAGVPTLVGTPNQTYDCSDIGRNTVTLYIASLTPAGDVVQSTVTTFIDVQDNNKACDGKRTRVNGLLTTESNDHVQDVSVSLVGSEFNAMTGADGAFEFGLTNTGGSYQVTPDKNDDALNGVSTLDIVMIQRHILSIAKLNTPYKLIAADITKDGKITAADLVELRKLVLGTTTSFSNNRSWRFVDKTYTFQDPTFAQGEAFPEVYKIDNLVSDMITDFVAVKVGDVNGNVKANRVNNGVESRSNESLVLTTNVTSFKKGQKVVIPVNAASSTSVNGMQFTMNFDASILSLDGINAADLKVNESNFGYTNVNNGNITTSWNDVNTVDLTNGQTLFNLTFTAIADGNTENVLTIGSDITPAEAYDADANVMNVAWEVSGRNNTSDFTLYQNVPNPFKDNTVIGFDLPSAMNATITVYDITGKVIKVAPINGVKGYNIVEVNKSEISAGVLYYSLRAGNYTATKKMIVIE